MKSIAELQTDNTTFSIGDAISDGWKLVSTNLGFYILGGIIAVVCGWAVSIIPFVGGLANNLIISPCFMASAIFITWRISRGFPWTDFGEVFKGFSYLSRIMVSSLIEGAVIAFLVVVFLFNFIPQFLDLISMSDSTDFYGNQEEMKAIFLSLFTGKSLFLFIGFMLCTFVVTVLWAFKIHFIVIYNMEAWQAMELSRKICTRNFFQMIGLFILLGLIVIISLIPCGIGLLFSMPLAIGSVYSAFAQVTRSDEEEEVKLDFTGGNA
jgi:uncharacterized membrane protein